ncbi:MAG: hypothetical protein LBD23_20560 [Oscillospiraceae bacterium]|nr:hypothetical protein [Oscillospiraceae bacterium]
MKLKFQTIMEVALCANKRMAKIKVENKTFRISVITMLSILIALSITLLILVALLSGKGRSSFVPDTDVIVPDGARLCGQCSGCSEYHFIWDDDDDHHHHVECGCDYDCHCHLSPEECNC